MTGPAGRPDWARPGRGPDPDPAHRTHLGPVRPLAWFEVEPAAFPRIDRVIVHRDGESMARTFWNARRPRRTGAR